MHGIPTAPKTMMLASHRLGGFLLHGGARLHRLSSGGNAVSPRHDIDRADHVGVFLETAFDTGEPRLRKPILRAYAAARRTRSACVRGPHRNKSAVVPCQLVAQLATQLEAASLPGTARGAAAPSGCSMTSVRESHMIRSRSPRMPTTRRLRTGFSLRCGFCGFAPCAMGDHPPINWHSVWGRS